MRTIANLREKIIQFKAQIDVGLEGIAIEMAESAKTLSQRNIQGHGVEGAAYTQGVHSYAEKKRKAGKQAAYVDLTYTGEMWANIGVLRTVRVEEHKVVALLGGKTQSASDKMGWNEERYSNFIENNLSDDDKRIINNIANRRIRTLIKTVGL